VTPGSLARKDSSYPLCFLAFYFLVTSLSIRTAKRQTRSFRIDFSFSFLSAIPPSGLFHPTFPLLSFSSFFFSSRLLLPASFNRPCHGDDTQPPVISRRRLRRSDSSLDADPLLLAGNSDRRARDIRRCAVATRPIRASGQRPPPVFIYAIDCVLPTTSQFSSVTLPRTGQDPRCFCEMGARVRARGVAPPAIFRRPRTTNRIMLSCQETSRNLSSGRGRLLTSGSENVIDLARCL